MFSLKGIHYKSWFVYKLITYLKLGYRYNIRYTIAESYVKPGDVVLDICSGVGELKSFLPENCQYICLDASFEFSKKLSQKRIKYVNSNLHEGLNFEHQNVDIIIMAFLCDGSAINTQTSI